MTIIPPDAPLAVPPNADRLIVEPGQSSKAHTLFIPKYLKKEVEAKVLAYFENAEGRIRIPVTVDERPPRCWQRTEIPMWNTGEIARISKRYEAQIQRDYDRSSEILKQKIQRRHDDMRKRLMQVAESSSTSQKDRDQIRYAIKRMDERKFRKIGRQEAHFHMEEFEAKR